MAHLGVLRALEENNIPIDYICGTSIGAIIGGLYASGYTIEEMEKIFLSNEFRSAVENRLESEYYYFYKQQQPTPEVFFISFDAKEKFKWHMPISVINPALMDYEFLEFFSSASLVSKGNFDSLMIPFFCVASDITNHKAKIFHSGNLDKCIRASMTFPVVFAPIMIDSIMLYDGGMYNNFPSKEMMNVFKPDVMIGVTITAKLPVPKEGDLLSVIQNVWMAEPDFNLGERGVLISPEVTDMSVLNFTPEAMQKAYYKGYEAGLAKVNEIRKLTSDSISIEELTAKRDSFKTKCNNIKLDSINITGVSNNQKEYLTKMMHKNRKDIDIAAFRTYYLNLSADKSIKNINATILQEDTLNILNIHLKTKQALTAKTGGYLSSNPSNYFFLGFDYNVLGRNPLLFKTNTFIGRYYSSFMFGARIDFPVQSRLYMEAELNINEWNYYKLKDFFFQYSQTNYLEQKDNNIILRFGLPIALKSKIIANIGYGKATDTYSTDDILRNMPTKDYTTFHNIDFGLSHYYYTLDNVQYPTDGTLNKIKFQYIYGHENYFPSPLSQETTPYSIQKRQWFQFFIKHKSYFQMTKNYSLGLTADIFYSFQQPFINYNSSLLQAGSYTPTIETLCSFYPEYHANQYAALGFENIFSLEYLLGIGMSLRLSAYAFLPISRLETVQNEQPLIKEALDKVFLIGSAALVMRTPLGPISFVASYHRRDDSSQPSFTASVNFGYLLSNNRNIER